MNDVNTLIQQLDDLLETEKTALISGDLQQLNEIVTEKEALIEALNAAEFEAIDTLPHISAKVTRNQALLEGALEGIRNAAKRLAELREIKKSLDTYDAQGRKTRIEDQGSDKLEKRA